MAPEQASSLPVGPPADIFAAGTILYEMLTGRPPFEATSLVDVLYAVLHQNPPPLSGSREIEALDRVIRGASDQCHVTKRVAVEADVDAFLNRFATPGR
jgi:serine/threonine protein kinase